MPHQIISNLQYDIILGMGWLNSSNLVIDWVVCSLELTANAKHYTVLALPVHSVTNVTLSSFKQCWLK